MSSLYAIVEEDGRQMTVREGDIVQLDYREADPGKAITLERVLMIGGEKTAIGAPTVKGASVSGVIKEQIRGPKLRGNKRRLHDKSQTHWGHRQPYTLVEIQKIKT